MILVIKIFFLLPVYNEEGNLRILLERFHSSVVRLGIEYHIIVFDDGSTDSSGKILKELSEKYTLTVIGDGLNHGLGYGFATLLRKCCELSNSDEDVAVVMDADCTHNPELIDDMLNNIRHGFDVVIASRYLTDSRIIGVTFWRRILSLGASCIMRLLYPIRGVKDYTCGFRAYSLSILRKAFMKFGDQLIQEANFSCMAEMLIKLRALDALYVEVPLLLRYDRKIGISKMDVNKTIKSTLRMVLRL